MKSRMPLTDKNQFLKTTIKNNPSNMIQSTKKIPVQIKNEPLKKEIEIKKNLQSQQNNIKKPSITQKMSMIEKKDSQKPVIKPQQKQVINSKLIKNQSKVRQMPTLQVKQDLFPCKQCGRSFVQASLKRHEKICKKIFVNKRKQFNSAKQRISKEQAQLLKNNKNKITVKNQKHQPMPLWKQQSLAFRLAMKAAKGLPKTEQQMKYVQNEKKMINTNMFKCKFCSRHFNDEAGKRHQPFCQKKAKELAIQKKKKMIL